MSSAREENFSLFYKSVKGFSMSLLAIFLLTRRGQLIHQAQAGTASTSEQFCGQSSYGNRVHDLDSRG